MKVEKRNKTLDDVTSTTSINLVLDSPGEGEREEGATFFSFLSPFLKNLTISAVEINRIRYRERYI